MSDSQRISFHFASVVVASQTDWNLPPNSVTKHVAAIWFVVGRRPHSETVDGTAPLLYICKRLASCLEVI